MDSLARDYAGTPDILAPLLPLPPDEAAWEALRLGGDSRTVINPASGTNKYLCPPYPAPDLANFASCTASPLWERGVETAGLIFQDLLALPPHRRAACFTEHQERVKAGLLGYFGAAGLADIELCPSGTDAVLAASLRVAAERPGEKMTALLPCAAETGTGVPLAAACKLFDGQQSGTVLNGADVRIEEIALRDRAGEPLADAEIDAAYARAASAATGRVVVYLTHGTKTGLIAPRNPPAGVDVIVDACQARIAPEAVAAYLRRGWPVVVTGSKFFAGPAFSGAVLFPRGRAGGRRPASLPGLVTEIEIGALLRWAAALASIEAFAPRAAAMPAVLRDSAREIAAGLAGLRRAVPVGGLQPEGDAWAELPSIFTFAVRDAAAPERKLSMAELAPIHRGMAERGVLVGQPVGLGPFGGLRIAVSARDATGGASMSRLFGALGDLIG